MAGTARRSAATPLRGNRVLGLLNAAIAGSVSIAPNASKALIEIVVAVDAICNNVWEPSHSRAGERP